MVYDTYRNELYARAIRKGVTPDSVVMDLGAGLGIHGLVAAAAGAKRVYLVEPEPLVQIAKYIAKANGLTDRVVILEGKIEEVELPEKVDLIISVFTGNLLYSEDLLPSLYFARDKYLKQGGKLIPDLAELLLAPVSAPELHAKFVGKWAEPNLGLDFSAARRFAGNEILWPAREELKLPRLGGEQVLSAVDMGLANNADCRGEIRCHIDQSGLCHGLLGWIRIRLGEEWLSTDPAAPEVHWSPAMLPIDPPLQLEAGEEVELALQRPANGDWTWSVKAEGGSRRHSSFLARADGPRRLGKLAPDYRPSIGKRGKNLLHILALMQEGKSNKEIAMILTGNDPESYPSAEVALQAVQEAVLRYSDNR